MWAVFTNVSSAAGERPDLECMVQEAKDGADAEIERLNRALQEAIKGQTEAERDTLKVCMEKVPHD